MTRKEIIQLAKNIDLMDKLNSISGLMEIDNFENKKLIIDDLINDIYTEMNEDKEIVNPVQNKKWLLNEINKKDPELAERLKNKRFAEIRLAYSKLTFEKKSI